MKRYLLVGALAMLTASPVFSETTQEFSTTLTAQWDAPTKRLNGVPLALTELDRYEVKFTFGGAVTDYTIAPTTTEATHVLTQIGEHCATVRVVDKGGLASDWADQVCINVTSKPQKLIIRFISGAN